MSKLASSDAALARVTAELHELTKERDILRDTAHMVDSISSERAAFITNQRDPLLEIETEWYVIR